MNLEVRTKSQKASALLLMASMSFAGAAFTCNVATVLQWLNVGLSAIATIGPLINPLIGAVAALAGKTVNVAIANDINKGLNGVNTDLPLLSSALTAYNANPSATTLQKVQALETAIQNGLNDSTLAANGITDPVSQQRILGAIQELLTDFQTIESDVPNLTHPSGSRMSTAELQRVQARMAPNAIKARMHAIVSPKSGNADVDAAFAQLVEASK